MPPEASYKERLGLCSHNLEKVSSSPQGWLRCNWSDFSKTTYILRLPETSNTRCVLGNPKGNSLCSTLCFMAFGSRKKWRAGTGLKGSGLFMGEAPSFFRFHQPAEARPVPAWQGHVPSGPFLGFLGWARPTGRRLRDGLRAMLCAGRSARQQWCSQLCYLPASTQNTILTVSF